VQGAADNKLTVRGEFCTTNPDDLQFPVKVLFLIDASSSMAATDPLGARVGAMIEVMDAMREPDPDDPTMQGDFIDGVEFGVVAFGLGANIFTEKCDDYVNRVGCGPGFSRDVTGSLGAAVAAGNGAGTTDYLIALDTAISMLAADMSNSDEEQLENSRYIIMFLSDGIPDADSQFSPGAVCIDGREWLNTGEPPEGDIVEEIAGRIDQMYDLARRYDVREMTFNGSFVARGRHLPRLLQRRGAELPVRGLHLVQARLLAEELRRHQPQRPPLLRGHLRQRTRRQQRSHARGGHHRLRWRRPDRRARRPRGQ
jgi:hypothetical protein